MEETQITPVAVDPGEFDPTAEKTVTELTRDFRALEADIVDELKAMEKRMVKRVGELDAARIAQQRARVKLEGPAGVMPLSSRLLGGREPTLENIARALR